MTFFSPSFLLLFLPLAAAVYSILPENRRIIALFAFSLAFYYFAAGDRFWALPLLALLAWLCTLFCPRFGILLLLFAFALFRAVNFTALGLSFFFMRAWSYLFDRVKEKNPLRAGTYFLLFPTVNMGPLARYDAVASGFARTVTARQSAVGIARFSAGLFKKLFFADMLLCTHTQLMSGGTALSAAMALFAYALYIYFDFSGYSDMAVGIGRIFGFELPENFDYPYLSRSVSEFFRKWHCTLGRWLFDYVYVPLGGSRHGKLRTLLSLAAVWTLTAIWHGTGICYLLWGAYFFVLSASEKLLFHGRAHFGRLLTFCTVCLGWVFFFSPNISDAAAFFHRLFGLGNTLLYCRGDLYDLFRLSPFFLLSALAATPLARNVFNSLKNRFHGFGLCIASLLLLLLSLSCLASGGHAPFLYASY